MGYIPSKSVLLPPSIGNWRIAEGNWQIASGNRAVAIGNVSINYHRTRANWQLVDNGNRCQLVSDVQNVVFGPYNRFAVSVEAQFSVKSQFNRCRLPA